MRTCVYCDKQLPESTHKGGRTKEYCNDACKNKNYRFRKQMRIDTERVSDTYWKHLYQELVREYKKLEMILQAERDIRKIQDEVRQESLDRDMSYIVTLEKSMEFHRERYEKMQISCAAKLRYMGMSEKDIVEFNAFWSESMGNIYNAYRKVR